MTKGTKLTDQERAELSARRTERLVARKKAQRDEKEEAIRAALRELDKRKTPFTKVDLQRLAGVSRARLYKCEPDLLREIDELIERTSVMPQRARVEAQSSQASLKKRLLEANEQVRRLREENKRLKAENERLSVENRALVAQVTAGLVR